MARVASHRSDCPYLSRYRIPFGRFRRHLQLSAVKVWLEICCDLVLPSRDIAESVRSVFLQRIADVVRERITLLTVYRNTTSVLVRKLSPVRRENADTNAVERLLLGSRQ
jgi:hypothetical protein